MTRRVGFVGRVLNLIEVKRARRLTGKNLLHPKPRRTRKLRRISARYRRRNFQ